MSIHILLKYFFLLFLCVITPVNAKNSGCAKNIFSPFKEYQIGQVNYLPNYGCIYNLQLAGHLPVIKEPCNDIYCSNHNASLFYWFVASQNRTKQTPIILWLNGGPGSSSFYGFFSENGPYFIDKKGTLQERAFAWNKEADFLMIDNPKGVGFSYAANNSLSLNDRQVAIELYNALEAFYQRYPELRKKPLFLSGESYAGKYVAELALQIQRHHASINLSGIMVGDGWVNPLVQQSSVADYAYSHGLINKVMKEKVKTQYKKCAQTINEGNMKQANRICAQINNMVAKVSGVDRHDIRTLAEIDYSPIIKYLNKPEVRTSLHVDPRVNQFKLFNNELSESMQSAIQLSASSIYEYLLSNKIPILVYNGLEDGTDSNFMGADLWLEQLSWPGKLEFNKAPTCKWKNDDTHDIAGYVRQARNLTQVKIRGAGHMAPMDQPEATLDMVNKFIKKKNWCFSSEEKERSI